MMTDDPQGHTGPLPHDLLAQLEDSYGARLQVLEADNRRMRRNGRLLGLGLAAAIGAIVVIFVAAGQMLATGAKDVVNAREFVLRDGNGATRGVWKVQDDGSARLVLNDRDGATRLRLTVNEGGAPGVAFVDAGDRTRVVLGVLPDETANLVLADRAGRARAVFGLSRDNVGSLVFADQFGSTRAGIGVDRSGTPSITLVDDGTRAAEPASIDEVADPEPEPDGS